ncbi:C-3 sterol dehydrogenase/C-4 decarboxylase [Lophiotrema nucula]|uniref:C-3 sterol dehydrogenase/C-4 decarboxylase n=1 Tax=Lophiotrema nucula TaxID=690887 RepID=A0A6A5YVX4_9PLEO|nr:C-3 sterol dehydrogenase/C-4 decarboxylase [Lophiotrema nucula]
MTTSNLGTVLVVGGSGFLGSHIVTRLLNGSHASSIIITSRNLRPHKDLRVTCHPVDIASQESVDKLFEETQPDVVIHTASPHPHAPASSLHAGNVNGTRNLLDAARRSKKTTAFVYTSSNSAVHPSPFQQTTEAESILYTASTAPNPYAATKAVADALVLSSNCEGLKTAVLRVPSVYGENDRNFIAQIVTSIRAGKYREQVGPDEKMHETVYAGSAAEAHILAAKALLDGSDGVEGEAFFITDNSPSPFFAFYRRCCAAAGYPVAENEVRMNPFWVVKAFASVGEWVVWIVSLGRRMPELRREDIEHLDRGWWWSCGKAERVLGYRPVMELDEAVRVSMEWGMENC